MIGVLVLTAPMLAILVYGLLEVKRSRLVGTAISLLTITGLTLVWFPGLATASAEVLQLGSGRDLVVYAWVGIVTLILLNLHLRIRRQMQLVTTLTRQIAMAGRQMPPDLAAPTTFLS